MAPAQETETNKRNKPRSSSLATKRVSPTAVGPGARAEDTPRQTLQAAHIPQHGGTPRDDPSQRVRRRRQDMWLGVAVSHGGCLSHSSCVSPLSWRGSVGCRADTKARCPESLRSRPRMCGISFLGQPLTPALGLGVAWGNQGPGRPAGSAGMSLPTPSFSPDAAAELVPGARGHLETLTDSSRGPCQRQRLWQSPGSSLLALHGLWAPHMRPWGARGWTPAGALLLTPPSTSPCLGSTHPAQLHPARIHLPGSPRFPK